MKNLNKKSSFYPNAKTKSLTVLLVTLFLLSTLAGTQLIGGVSAAIPYTQYTGTLNGADWALRIPDPWNGMLVVFCRGYSQTPVNPVNTLSVFSGSMLNQGFAVAASNYGVVGGATEIGQVTTYELTMYLIDNYDVTGKTFLWGYSMGGGIALLLGEKYPDVYSGVLDLAGVKDLKAQYAKAEKWSKMNEAELTAELMAIGAPVPPFGYSSMQDFIDYLATAIDDMELETGGTPATHPTAYEDLSAVYHADIQIPVITVHGTADPLVLYVYSLSYQNAVAKAYRSSLYRLYGVPGAEHVDTDLFAEVPAHFDELIEWSNELTGAHDWPMFGYDPQRCGYSTSNAPNTNQTLWTSPIAGQSGAHPAVVNGKVYVNDYSGNVYCFNAATGAQIWNYTAGDNVRSAPAVVDGKVYVTSRDNNTYCLDALTGTKIWSYTMGGVPGSGPVVADGKVFVGSNDGKLYCLRADYGQVEWKFTAGGEIDGPPAFADGKVYVGSLDNNVYCVDAATGTLEWSYNTGGEVYGAPAVADGRVFVGSIPDNTYCLDAATGAKIWNYPARTVGSPAVAYDRIYVGSGDSNVYCLDAATGALIWNYTTGSNIWSSPAVADGKVFVGSFDRKLYCLDAATGALIWSYETGGMIWGSPVVANGVVYAVSLDRIVYAFSAWEPIPEALTVGIMLLLSTVAVIVSVRYFRKRQKWKKW